MHTVAIDLDRLTVGVIVRQDCCAYGTGRYDHPHSTISYAEKSYFDVMTFDDSTGGITFLIPIQEENWSKSPSIPET